MQLKIDKIRLDGGTQIREATDPKIVAAYADAMARISEDSSLAKFPPVVVFKDEEGQCWLADGFHRVEASKLAGHTEIAAEVKRGSQRDALAYALGANATHGAPRTARDVRKAIAIVFADPEWQGWTDRQVAKLVGCGHTTVRAVRSKMGIAQPIIIKAVQADGSIQVRARPLKKAPAPRTPVQAASAIERAAAAFLATIDRELSQFDEIGRASCRERV